MRRPPLWCEHSRLPLPSLNGEDLNRGVYDLDMMDNEEWMELLRKQQESSDANRARSDETISKIQSILKRVAATQERTKKLLSRSGPRGE